MKEIEIDISITMSSHQKIKVPENFVENPDFNLEDAVEEQIDLPQSVFNHSNGWTVDDFVVL